MLASSEQHAPSIVAQLHAAEVIYWILLIVNSSMARKQKLSASFSARRRYTCLYDFIQLFTVLMQCPPMYLISLLYFHACMGF